jgi:hypothetical protein
MSRVLTAKEICERALRAIGHSRSPRARRRRAAARGDDLARHAAGRTGRVRALFSRLIEPGTSRCRSPTARRATTSTRCSAPICRPTASSTSSMPGRGRERQPHAGRDRQPAQVRGRLQDRRERAAEVDQHRPGGSADACASSRPGGDRHHRLHAQADRAALRAERRAGGVTGDQPSGSVAAQAGAGVAALARSASSRMISAPARSQALRAALNRFARHGGDRQAAAARLREPHPRNHAAHL